MKPQITGVKNPVDNTLLLYGRGPRAILSQLLAAGIDADLDFAKKIINDVLVAYPKVAEYIDRQHHAVYDPGYAENPFGRRRYFFFSKYNGVMAAQKRESVNFPEVIGWGSKTGVNSVNI